MALFPIKCWGNSVWVLVCVCVCVCLCVCVCVCGGWCIGIAKASNAVSQRTQTLAPRVKVHSHFLRRHPTALCSIPLFYTPVLYPWWTSELRFFKCKWQRHLPVLTCTHCKSLWIRASAKCVFSMSHDSQALRQRFDWELAKSWYIWKIKILI